MSNQDYHLSIFYSGENTEIRQQLDVDAQEGYLQYNHSLKKEGKPEDCTFGILIDLNLESDAWQLWLPWSAPEADIPISPDTPGADLANAQNRNVQAGSWSDPLAPQTLTGYTKTFFYGAEPWSMDKPQIGFVPRRGNLCVMPMVTLLNMAEDRAITIFQHLDDAIIDLEVSIQDGCRIRFLHRHQRVGDGRAIQHHYRIVEHPAHWRAGLARVVQQFPEFFHSVLEQANTISGLGAYSTQWVDFDASKMNEMGFAVNWKASFDFPYMGQFLPPVDPDQEWQGFHGQPVSIARMADYASQMKAMGYHVLNYFNVFEFGTKMSAPEKKDVKQDWEDPVRFFREHFPNAALKPMTGEQPTFGYTPLPDNGAYTSWEECLAVDPADSDYAAFLLEQIKRHLQHIPDSSGFCIDRLDWIRLFNEAADDGLAFAQGKKVRSMLTSWQSIIETIAELAHSKNKVVWANNHTKRIDVMRHLDGIFDEFTYLGSALNTTALLSLFKPALGWVANEKQILSDPDRFFQRFIHMGVMPMAPFPGNDHSLAPSATIDALYLKYGPVLRAMQTRTWVLDEFECQLCGGSETRLNLFRTKDQLLIVLTNCDAPTTVELKKNPQFTGDFELLLPEGAEADLQVETGEESDRFTVSKAEGTALIQVALRPNELPLK